MSRTRFRITFLILSITAASALLGGAVVLSTLSTALRDAGVDAASARGVERAVLVSLASLGVVLLGVALVSARALTRALHHTRARILSHARGDVPAAVQAHALRDLGDIEQAVGRLSARVAAREAELSREGAEVSILLDSVSEGILRLDAAGRITRANPAVRALLNLTQRAVGQPVGTQIRHAELRRILERAAAGAAVASAEITLDERRLLISAHPLGLAGEGGAVVAVVDLTEVRRLEGVRRDFVANVSHELKTPLTSIRGYVETMLSDELPEDTRRKFLDIVYRNADRLHHIVDDLLDLSRLESGVWRPEVLEVDATEIIEDVWSSCAESAARRGVTFVPPADAVHITADPGAFRQVVTNLLDNALRYTPDGGRVEVRAARANGAAARGLVTFEVRDNGAGIPTDALPRIFERFYRADPARSRAAGGTGLGLSIVKHLVESMGGDVSAESELGRGTVIRFRLPSSA